MADIKSLKDMLYEQLNERCSNFEEEEGEIKSEKDFRAWAESKFKKTFGDEFDEDKFKETVDGFLKDHEQEVKDDKWAELVGEMNKSFAK